MSGDAALEFRRSARELLGQQDPATRLRARRGNGEPLNRAAWQQLADAGWFSVLVKEADGGLGLGLPELTALAEEAGRHLLPEPFVAAAVLPIATLCAAPPSEARSRWLAALSSGSSVAVVAWQEQAGILGPLEGTSTMSATSHGDRVLLNGCKRFVLFAPVADVFLVSANTPQGLALYAVDAKRPGVSVESVARLDETALSTVRFDSVALGQSDQVASGEQAVRALAHGLEVARIAQGAELLGVARAALALTLEHLRTRVQFGRPIGAYQALQHRVVDAYIQIELGAAGLEAGVRDIARDARELPRSASRIKARCAHAALLTTRLSIQLHGAIGYTDEHAIGLYFKRALAACSWLGSPDAHRARHLALARSRPLSAHPTRNTATARTFTRDADWDAMPEASFRQLVRAFLERHYPKELRHLPYRVHWATIRPWYLTLAKQGWIAPAWPKAFGGMELPPDKLLALIEEQEEYGVARPPDQGLVMLGPVLMRFGSEAQQQRYLPKILSGEHVWCQGYSEPGAGSDLAALSTEATLEGDHFIVQGQKTWITLAQDATHMFMLVRTAKREKKQDGISFLLVDLQTPGVTVRPNRNLAGDEEFCEVFLDQVRVPTENLVGELHCGWEIARTPLGFERLFGGSPKNAQYALKQLERVARARGLWDDPAFAARYATLLLDTADLAAAYAHFAAIVRSGQPLPAQVPVLKIWATETHERIAAMLIETAAEDGACSEAVAFDGAEVHVCAPLISALAATILSGSNEIQRNILAKQVLGLPT